MTSIHEPITTFKDFSGGIMYIETNNTTQQTALSDGQNFEIYPTEDGNGLCSMPGNISLYNFPAGTSIINVFTSIQKNTEYIFIHTIDATDGKLWLFNGTPILKISGLSKTATISGGVDFNNKFIFGDGNQMYSIQIGASSETNLLNAVDALGNTIKGCAFRVYDGRIWTFTNNSTANILNSCALMNETDWASSAVNGAYYKKTYRNITAIENISGGLLICTDISDHILTGSGATNYVYSDLSTVGCAGPQAIVRHDRFVFSFNKKAVYPIGFTDTNQIRESEKITKFIEKTFANLDPNSLYLTKSLSVLGNGRNEIWFLFKYYNDSANSYIWIYDFNNNAWIKRVEPNINCITISSSGQIYSGTPSGKFINEYQGMNFAGSSMVSNITFPPMTFGTTTIKKYKKPPVLTLDNTSNNDFYIKYIYNYDTTNFSVYHINKNYAADNIWGEGCWDINDWAKNIPVRVLLPTPRNCISLQIQLYTQDPNQAYIIKSIEFRGVTVKNN